MTFPVKAFAAKALGLAGCALMLSGGASAARIMTVDVTAQQPLACSMALGATSATDGASAIAGSGKSWNVDFGDMAVDRGARLSGAHSASVDMAISCNVAFAVTTKARFGGLKSDAASSGAFANAIPYTLTGPIFGSLSSAELKSGVTRLFLPSRMSGAASLTLAGGDRPLVAGRYAESITVTVLPVL